MQVLTSVQNPKVKSLRRLRERKGREDLGAYLLEGTKLLNEAVSFGHSPAVVMATSEWWQRFGEASWVRQIRGECFEVSDAVLAAVATTQTPDPVVAMVPRPVGQIPEWRVGDWIVIADRLQDPGNLGTIIRAADAAGARMVVATNGCVDPYSPKVVRAAMGAFFHLPVLQMSLEAFRARLPDCPIHALVLDGDVDVYRCDLSGGGAFLIGNEGAGLGSAERALADVLVKIPMPGQAESLNAAMAATVCLFEAVRQKQGRA